MTPLSKFQATTKNEETGIALTSSELAERTCGTPSFQHHISGTSYPASSSEPKKK